MHNVSNVLFIVPLGGNPHGCPQVGSDAHQEIAQRVLGNVRDKLILMVWRGRMVARIEARADQTRHGAGLLCRHFAGAQGSGRLPRWRLPQSALLDGLQKGDGKEAPPRLQGAAKVATGTLVSQLSKGFRKRRGQEGAQETNIRVTNVFHNRVYKI